MAGQVAGATAQLADLIRAAGSVVALTGAGISVPSGIPDFRTPGTGLWENVDPMEVAHIDAFRHDPDRFWSFYGERFASLHDKLPNDAHRALVELESHDLLVAVITQNIDRLHEKAGTQTLIELHGTIAHSSCEECGASFGLDEVRARLAAGDRAAPLCDCGAPLKPNVVLFGEMLPETPMQEAVALAGHADLMLCIGSSLEVHPVAGLPSITLRAGGEIAIVTHGETPLDGDAVLKLDGDVEEEMQELLEALS